MKAYESIVRNDNRSNRYFGPTVDAFIDDIDARMFLNVPFKLITENNYTIDVPILMGITSNEGAFVDGKMMTVKCVFRLIEVDWRCLITEMWMSYGKQGYRKFKSYIESVVLPALLRKSHFDGFNKRQVCNHNI